MTGMDAETVKAALRRRWSTTEYVTLEEASLSPMRMYATADFVAISCWPSRGFQVDGVEVKVSYSDWKRERDNPAKSQLWRLHSDRWWLAAPRKLAERVVSELPDGWGLLAVDNPYVARVVVQAPKLDRVEMEWPKVVGLFRSAQASGIAALARAEQMGYQRGLSVECQTSGIAASDNPTLRYT